MSYSLASRLGAQALADLPQPSRSFKPGVAVAEVVGAVIMAAIAVGALALGWIVANKSGFGQWLPLFFLGAVGIGTGALAGTWIARALDREPVVRLTHKGLVSPQLAQPVRWHEVEDIELDAQGGRWALRLRLKPVPGLVDRRSFWTGRNPAVPHVNLYRLPARDRKAVLELALDHWERVRRELGLGEPPRAARDREAQAFDEQLERITPRAWTLWGIVGINVAVWVAGIAAGWNITGARPDQLFAWGGNSASAVVMHGQWWRLFTSAFLHGGIAHIAMNMACLWAFGRLLLRLVGHGQFVLVYVATALCGSALSLHFAAQQAVSVGASGAVFGVLGALWACSRKYRDAVPEASGSKLKSGAVFFIIWSLAQGFARQGTDNAAHVGGLLAGLVLGWLMVAVFDAKVAERKREAALGAFLCAIAVPALVLTTPVPRTWHHELFDAAQELQRLAPDYNELGRQLQEVAALRKGNRTVSLAENEKAKVALAPVCARIDERLARIHVPPWERIGQFAAAMKPMCGLMFEALELERRVAAGETTEAAVQPRMAELMAKIKASHESIRETMKPQPKEAKR